MFWHMERVRTLRFLLTCNALTQSDCVKSLLTCNGLGHGEGADCEVLTDM